ncbi:unnamed protein product, partial [Rangifer tarandus platyrhynchus]
MEAHFSSCWQRGGRLGPGIHCWDPHLTTEALILHYSKGIPIILSSWYSHPYVISSVSLRGGMICDFLLPTECSKGKSICMIT